ncbi:MFS transporter [Glutamicibacter uratoxydans]|uniref:MFS transporter n=1 Tax=Glutamicibacter uratoxydans TaxID=43667 RepID=A0A4Y4DS08_GLUUR|nr:MFS transporter [Glutamicibacter uratoxydans]GED06148.1 MFS transporter [Glutamicibacter uratoxydans]
MPASPESRAAELEKRSWAPMAGLFLAQVLMSFNVSALPISLGGMVQDFGVPPTTAGSTIVVYGLSVAALVMTGAKLGQRVGWVLIFRCTLLVFIASSLMMLLGPTVAWAIGGQVLAGAAAAIIVPALVALIAENYKGEQQATAVGSLGTFVGWRPIFAVTLVLAVAVVALSFKLRADQPDPAVKIDLLASALVGAAIVLLTLGFNNLNGWGVLLASDTAPFALGPLSPAPVLVVLGLVFGQLFFLRTRGRMRRGQVPLVDLSVLDHAAERAAVYAMFIIVAMEAAVNFTVPLYIQVVQGRTPFDTSLAMMPFNLTVFITATLIVRFYKKYTPRAIALFSFTLTTAALVWLSFVVTNNWETLPTILGLVVFGIGQGALVTLVFNVLVTAAPKHLAGDVGSLRGTTQNLASAVGTAVMGAVLVTTLSAGITSSVQENPQLPEQLVAQVDLDNVDFMSNEALKEALANTTATHEQVARAVEINEQQRLRTLKLGFLVLAGLSLAAAVPASRLPKYRPGEIPE